MADAVSRLDGPVVVAGDFNTTPYAPIFETFLNTARVSTFHDFPATFPAALGGLGIPIDHILVRDAELADLASVGSIGSDHRPLRALVKLPRKLAATATNDKTG
jgi:endonuclease/exonuclease/phosphatase (EEP) superfamily protein YafD